jgi:hypothetical protein
MSFVLSKENAGKCIEKGPCTSESFLLISSVSTNGEQNLLEVNKVYY